MWRIVCWLKKYSRAGFAAYCISMTIQIGHCTCHSYLFETAVELSSSSWSSSFSFSSSSWQKFQGLFAGWRGIQGQALQRIASVWQYRLDTALAIPISSKLQWSSPPLADPPPSFSLLPPGKSVKDCLLVEAVLKGRLCSVLHQYDNTDWTLHLPFLSLRNCCEALLL